ncbi:MAG: hypothetical protein ACR2FN_06100 [Chitinophagaceae bacterium]
MPDYYKNTCEYIFFLQHPEKKDFYLIIQKGEITMQDFLDQFNRSGSYENGLATLPHNKVQLVEKIAVPDKSLFGLCYFICHELEEITYKEDERWPYGDWGWYIIKEPLQTAKWLQQYIEKNEAKKILQKQQQKTPTHQTSLIFPA